VIIEPRLTLEGDDVSDIFRFPIRFKAHPTVARARPRFSRKFDMSVSITPGATAFHAIPSGPSMAAVFYECF